MRRLAERYPGDPSVAVTLLLNLVVLEPGQTLRLDPATSTPTCTAPAIELMGASDNVVRGGLTVKQVDVDELLRVFDTTPLADPVVPATAATDLAAGVQLVRLEAGDIHRAAGHELWIDIARRGPLPGPRRRAHRRRSTTYVVTPLTRCRVSV